MSVDGTVCGALGQGGRHDFALSFIAFPQTSADAIGAAQRLARGATLVIDADQDGRRAVGLAKAIRHERPGVPCLLYTAHVEQHPLAIVKACGLSGVIDKAKSVDEFFAAITAVRHGLFVTNALISVAVRDEIVLTDAPGPAAASDELTEREREVLALMAEGLANREIGQKLFISENTVKNHVRRILDKLDASSRMAAVVYAVRRRIVDIS